MRNLILKDLAPGEKSFKQKLAKYKDKPIKFTGKNIPHRSTIKLRDTDLGTRWTYFWKGINAAVSISRVSSA